MIEIFMPLGSNEWNTMAFELDLGRSGIQMKDGDALKRKHITLKNVQKPTGK